jgi:hypothetical protein
MAKLVVHYTNATAGSLPYLGRGAVRVSPTVIDHDAIPYHPKGSKLLAINVPKSIYNELKQYLFQRGKFLYTLQEVRAEMKDIRETMVRSEGLGL